MSVELVNPGSLPKPFGYAHVGVATGSRQVFIAGQVGHDADGNLVGDDLAAQTEQAYANLHAAITAVGGTFADIAKLTVYIVDYTPDKIREYGKGAKRAAERLGLDTVRPKTIVGVQALFQPDLLIEIDAVAVLD